MRRTILATLVTLTALSPIAVAQSRFTIVPSLSVAGVYDDNLFAETDSSAGKMMQLRPTVEGNFESPRLLLISLYSQDMLRSNFSSLNTAPRSASSCRRRSCGASIRARCSPPAMT